MPISVLTAQEMKRVESETAGRHSISEYDMILQAGESVFKHADRLFSDCNSKGIKNWVFICGKGHNGADALQAALLAHEKGYKIIVYQLASVKGYSSETKRLQEKCLKKGLSITFVEAVEDLFIPTNTQLIVEGLLGAGLKKVAAGLSAECVLKINGSGKAIFSIDIPSGLFTDSSETPLHAKATTTLSLGSPKISSLFYPSRNCYGERYFNKLCFPDNLTAGQPSRLSVFTRQDASDALPERPFNAHKYSTGKTLVIAGSTGMHGAPVLAALSAMRAGAGMVRLAVPGAIHSQVNRHTLEIISLSMGDNRSHWFSSEHADDLDPHIKWADAVLLGPGLGKHTETRQFLNTIMERIPPQRLVMDGDGLWFFNPENKVDRPDFPGSEILATPHSGEFVRMGGRYCYEKPMELIQNIRKVAAELNINILLKGPTNILVTRDTHCTILPFGDPGLATAGTGDVLAGSIAGLFCHLDVKSAAGIGVAAHSEASRQVQQRGLALTLMASDLINQMPAAFKRLAKLPAEKTLRKFS